MSTSDRALLEETQKELQMWKNRYSTVFQENEGLKAAMAKCVCNDELQAKRQRSGIPTDPLELPEPCAMRILQFLPSIDLLKATEVSKQWKIYIESGSKLMKSAMNGTVLNINFDRTKLSEVILHGFQREYRHMKISFDSDVLPSTVSSSLLYPAIKQSPTLETLSVSFKFDAFPEFFEQKFSNLVKLELSCCGSPFGKVPKFSYPELTSLNIYIYRFEMVAFSTDTFKQFLRAFPKLQHLEINSDDGDGILSDDNEETIPEMFDADPSQPKLETIVFPFEIYFSKFLRSHQNSLTKLMIGEMTTLSLSFCLRDLKQLKFLTVKDLEHNETAQEISFPQNESIVSLRINHNHLSSDQFYQILIALPSLKELAVVWYEAVHSSDVMRFIGANMRNLKWYKINETTHQDLEVYNEVKQNANQYINTSFELTTDRDVDFWSFEDLQI